MALLPARGSNLTPSSLLKTTTSMGRLLVTPLAFSTLIASMAPTTPTQPSKMPAFGTVSMWEPVMTGGRSSFLPGLLPIMFPTLSVTVRRPTLCISPVMNRLASKSSSVKMNLETPPASVFPISPRVSRSPLIRSAEDLI